MKYSLEEIKTLYDRAEKTRSQLKNDIEMLNNNTAALNEAAQNAAKSGELEHYKSLKAEAANLEAEIYVKQAQLNAARQPVSSEDIRSAWKDYAAKRDKEFDLKLKEFEKHRRELAREFKDLTDYQSATLKERNTIAAFTGVRTDNLDAYANPSDQILSEFPVKTIPKTNMLRCGGMMVHSDDVKYFFASGLIKNDDIGYYQNVITHHLP